MRTITTLLLTAFFTTACAGDRDGAPDESSGTAGDMQAGDAQLDDAQLDDTLGADAADHDRSDAAHGHDTAEPGEGQTLLVIMQKLGSDMVSLTHGIMTEDTALVARSAADVAEHPSLAPEELERIHTELGTGMSEFERLDAAVHEASVALHDAARTGDMDAVLERLHEVQRGCVECHTQFRQRLRTNTGN